MGKGGMHIDNEVKLDFKVHEPKNTQKTSIAQGRFGVFVFLA
jgi:hypothetical protein